MFPSVLAPHQGGCGTRLSASDSPRRYPSAAQAEGAAQGIRKPCDHSRHSVQAKRDT
ncbi:MAG: hypothetical protein ABL880_02265 [Methylotenera sp.]